MDVRKIAVGGAFWFAGISVPVLQHALLYAGAGVASTRGISPEVFYNVALKDFLHMSPLIWVYLAAMWLVGTALVYSGLTTVKQGVSNVLEGAVRLAE